MNAKEILKTIEDQGITVADFAYGDFGAPEDFKLSEETAKKKQKKDKSYKDYSDLNSKLSYNDRKDNKDLKILRDRWYNTPSYTADANKEWLDSIGVGEYDIVEQVGGEGEGDHWHSVKYFKDHNVYIKTTGFYSSYNGTDFYNGYGEEVKPQQKTITVYN